MVNLSKFISNKKNIEWSCSFNLQLNLLPNFVQSLIMLGLKKFTMVTNFFKGKKIINFLKIIKKQASTILRKEFGGNCKVEKVNCYLKQDERF